MKPNEAPDKIWMDSEWVSHFDCKDCITENSIEYVRTDAFIKKACDYLQEHLIDYWSQGVTDESSFIERFKNYMKGE